MAKEIKLTGGNTMPIRDFKFEWFSPNPSIVMVAKRRSGKSFRCRAIIKYFNYLPGGVIISKTEKMSCFYGEFFPDAYIHYEYKSEIIANLLERQSQIIEKCKEKYKRGRKVDPRTLLIMDDCLASKGTWMNDQPILEIFYNGRHYQILFILTMQFPLGIRPELRCNFDYIFLLAEDFYSNQKRIYDHYAGMFPSFDFFRQVFLQLTSDYGSMVICNQGGSKPLLDKVFHYKASGKEEIRNFGCRQFRDFSSKNFDPRWDKGNRGFNVEKFVQRKGKPDIKVYKTGNDRDYDRD
jgi:hypothetical protein